VAVPDLPPPPEAPPSLAERAVALAAARPPQAFFAVVGVAGAVLALAVFAGSFRTVPPPEISLPRASESGPAPQAVAATEVVVHVAGAVARPGVYRLDGAARVADLIDEAGGPAADADVHQLNLAAQLRDGDRIYVPRVGEPAPAGVGGGGGEPSAAEPVDLNRATQSELEELPGVGPATARAIVAYRDEHGPFRSVDELMEVRGIGPAKLDGLRDLVRV
jgi:competence protein ComEA